MDISALIGGNEPDLNQELSAVTPAGDSVFSSPFGSATSWKSPSGAVRVSFIFDPYQEYDETSLLASIQTDFFEELKEALAHLLVPKEHLARRKLTKDEHAFRALKANLPESLFTKLLMNDKEKLDQYLGQVTATANAFYEEEKLLIEAIRNTDFAFSQKIAIDAFPNIHDEESYSRKGVLTFLIEGGKYAMETLRKPEDTLDVPKVERRSHRKKRSTSAIKRDQEELTALEHRLKMVGVKDLENTKCHFQKEIPEESEAFFEAVSKWFHTVVGRRTQIMEAEQNSHQTSRLYH